MTEKFPQYNNEEKADPVTFSPLSSSIKFNRKGEKRGDSVIDENTGTEYVLISGVRDSEREIENIEVELFISLLSKGILHVSDVVEKDGQFYSKKMPLENIKPGEKMELEAENLLLAYLFSDWDKIKLLDDESKKSNEEKTTLSEHHNFIEDKRGAFAHFDYDVALGNHHNIFQGGFMFRSNDPSKHSGISIKDATTIKEIENRVYESNESIVSKLKRYISGRTTKQLLKILSEKIKLFENHVGDKIFFDTVLKKSKLNINLGQFYFLDGETAAEKEESLRKYFIERLEVLKEAINK